MNLKSLPIALLSMIILTSCEPTLIKNTETKSTSSTTVSTTILTSDITNKNWKITLLNSYIISGEVNDFHLKLDSSTGTFESKAGCNQIFGQFQLEDNFISFSKIGSTKMYCSDTMKIENSFISILSQTSKVVVIDSSKFLLLRDDMVIAQFELVK